METTLTLLDFRRQMARVLDRVEKGERIFLSKKGHLKAVLISPQEYLTKFIQKDPLLDKIQKSALDKSLDKITLEEINTEIRLVREEIIRK